MTKKFFFMFLLFSAHASAAYWSVGVLIGKNGSFEGEAFLVNFSSANPPAGDYSARLLDENVSVLYEESFSADFSLASDPPVSSDEAFVSLSLPFFDDAESAAFFHKEEYLGSVVLPKTFCDFDGVCEKGESGCSDCGSEVVVSESFGFSEEPPGGLDLVLFAVVLAAGLAALFFVSRRGS